MAGRRVIRGVVAAGLSLLLSGCWLQPGFDGGRTRWNPWEDQITPANVASLEELWSVEIPSTRPMAVEPLVYGNRVFLSTETLAPIPGRYSSSIGVMALDAATGETVWEQVVNPPGEVGVPFRPVTFVEGELWLDYLPKSSGDCAAVTVRLDRHGTVVGVEPSHPISGAMQSGPYVAQTYRTLCDLMPQTLSVRDSRTLQTLWTAESLNFGPTIVSGDLVITAAGAFPLAGCGAPTCAPIWSQSDAGTVVAAGPHTDVFFYEAGGLGYAGFVEARSRDTGTRRWLASLPGSSADFAIDDDRVYVTSNSGDTMLRAYDVDGCGAERCAPEWQGEVATGETGLRPTVAGDVVFALDRQGTVHAFAADGCGPDLATSCPEIASIDTGLGDRIREMSVSGGRLFVASHSGSGTYTVKAFAPPSAP